MSLLSSRGRFTSDAKQNNVVKSSLNKSALSSVSQNPSKLLKTEKNEKQFFDNKFISKHLEYNKKINSYNDAIYNDYKSVKQLGKNKKRNIKLIVMMVIVEFFTLIGIVALGSFIRMSKMTQNVSFNKAAVQNTNIDENTLAVMKGYKTVAIFGVDSRTGSIDKGNNSDVNIIANLNLETGEAQLVSVYRDLYLSISDKNSYDKLNTAYRKGGPEQAVKTINKCLDLNIVNFFSFNWKAVADGIELLGGIDLNITKSEYRYMNAFIHETCIATGIDAKNPAAHYIKSSGEQHLDGVQAVAYGRLRLMDSDFQRVERQKRVIELCLQKAKKLDIPKLRLIMEAVLPQIAYEFDMNEMLSIIRIINKVNITGSYGLPETNNLVTMDMGGSGDCVVALSLEKAVIKLHEVLFGDTNYTPSTAVKRYSNRIDELRLKFAEENKIKESIKESEREESERLAKLKPKKATVSKLKKSTKSNTTKKNTNPNSDIEVETVVPLLDFIDYDEEPEEDENDDEISNNEIAESEETKDTTVKNKPEKVDAPFGEVVDDVNNTKVSDLPIATDKPGKISGNVDYNGPVSAPGVSSAPTQSSSSPEPMSSANSSFPSNSAGSSGFPSNPVGEVISGPPMG